ncbi:glycosyltransferase family 4 protein [Streptomyces telluris]|uniref:Glycosyltransferase family 4 protein n=1 Tax=Streptomyces telluris TaxID=2720021 RepID=A0A9X2RNI6_9ACTN|nr:glycosyltransferase family 4 protein [Streptomyces telluris]MCQ8772049.1 glycosyltransferase family 4 protein [Streptomyces telluris]NJP78837.1 glycosyltransferase family 4 protein [Streptomyces telluris]
MTPTDLRAALPATRDWQGRHVVVCNWRDSRHPQAGGAELYCEEVARQLHDAGVRVTYLTSRPRGTARREDTGFGSVVRGGGRFTVYAFVLLWLLRHRRSVAGVIDSQNGIPFFTPLALRRRTPVVLLIHHVHQGQFALWFPRPVAGFGRWLEGRGSGLVYGRRAVCAVSPSTRAEIRRWLAVRGPVHFAPAGLDPVPPAGRPRQRAAAPRIVCVGRLVTQKRVDRLVRAVPALRRELPDVELHVVGDGEARDELRALVDELGVGHCVTLHGRVQQEERDALVDSAWITATTSLAEGWGLSVMEAAAAGVPALAYDVPGLRDTIRHDVTGWLLGPDDDLASGLAKALRAVAPPQDAARWEAECREWAARFSWTATAAHLLAALTAEDGRLHGRTGREKAAERRTVTDACTLVSAPADVLERADLAALRTTDLIDLTGPRPGLLLLGADERDAEAVLARIGVDTGDQRVSVRLARHSDILGWQAHPPSRARRHDAGRRRASTRAAGRGALLALLALFALALALRLAFTGRSYDVFVDELYYTAISRHLADGEGPVFDGQFFALHPPALFALLAASMRLTGQGSGDLLHQVLDLRPVVAVTGALTVVAVTALLRRAVRTPAALLAGLFLGLDPFLNRFDSRVMLEAQATAAAALGMLVLARTPATPRGRAATGAGAGLLFALAVTTKEPYALGTFVPVTVLGFAARGEVRRMRLTAAAVTLAGYAVYVVTTAATGNWAPWWAQKTDGIARALGIKQISGFNSGDGSVAFTDRLLVQLGQFAVPYALIALGTAATAWLLWSRVRRPEIFADRPGRILITAWAACTLLHLLYAMALGTLEEQMFYPLVVTSTAAVALAADVLLRDRDRGRGRGRGSATATRALAVLAALALTTNAVVWARVHTRHDDALRRTLAWSRAHLPEGSVVAATDEGTSFVLPGARLAEWRTTADLRRDRVDYLVLSTELVQQGYARIGSRLPGVLEREARLVHSERGETVGALRVYDVRSLVAGSGSGSGKAG